MGNDAESPAAEAAGAGRTSCAAGWSTEKRRDQEGKGQRVRRGIGMRLRRRRAEKEEAREAIWAMSFSGDGRRVLPAVGVVVAGGDSGRR